MKKKESGINENLGCISDSEFEGNHLVGISCRNLGNIWYKVVDHSLHYSRRLLGLKWPLDHGALIIDTVGNYDAR